MKKKYSIEDTKKWVDLRLEGKTYKEISEVTDVPISSIAKSVQKYLEEGNKSTLIEKGKPKGTYKEQDIQQWIEEAKKGSTLSKISQRFDVPEGTISAYFSKRGLSLVKLRAASDGTQNVNQEADNTAEVMEETETESLPKHRLPEEPNHAFNALEAAYRNLRDAIEVYVSHHAGRIIDKNAALEAKIKELETTNEKLRNIINKEEMEKRGWKNRLDDVWTNYK